MYETGDLVALKCGKVTMIVTGHGDPLNESKDSVNVHWEENGYIRNGFFDIKCLRVAPKETEEALDTSDNTPKAKICS